MHCEKRILFICKSRNNSYGKSYGLHNSARLVAEAIDHGKCDNVKAKVVSVVDNNCIDREVTKFQPDIVIIEALWVVPEKFTILTKLHPRVQWYVRLHSETPFLANEGIAMNWISQLVKLDHPNVHLAANSPDMVADIESAFGINCEYLPNIYWPNPPCYDRDADRDCRIEETGELNIGCFGAIRPLKNQLAQAIAAIRFADSLGFKLRFHINADRVEGKGEEILKNLRSLFPINGHELVEHPWLHHHDFLELVDHMDLGMQVSLSETFNIVAADFVSRGVPIAVSPDIEWMPRFAHADPNDSANICKTLNRVWAWRSLTKWLGRRNLNRYSRRSHQTWLNFATRSLDDCEFGSTDPKGNDHGNSGGH